MSVKRRLLGVDFGTVRVGLAVSDQGHLISSQLETYHRQNEEQDRRHFQKLVDDEDIGLIILGLPVHLNGHEGEKARQARQFGSWLEKTTHLPVVYWDERFTSLEAENFLLSAGLTNKKRKSRRDQLAAQILLQSYIEAGCPENPTIGPLDE